MNKADWVVIGRFGRPHGVKGFITVHSFTEPSENILEYTNWHAFINKEWKAISIIRTEIHHKGIIVQIEGYSVRETAALLTNAEIAVDKDQLAELEPGEYYWHQLIGMTVQNQKGEQLGTVTEVIATGANDVLVVQGDTKLLIPYVPEIYIIEVNENQHCITVDWEVDF